MKKLSRKYLDDLNAFRSRIQEGEILATGTFTGVNGATRTITDATASFTTGDNPVYAGCWLVDSTMSRAAKVLQVTPLTLVVDDWPGFIALDTYKVLSKTVNPDDLKATEYMDGQSVITTEEDDGIYRVRGNLLQDVFWEMTNGVALVAERSDPFFVPRKARSVEIEWPVAHANALYVEKFIGDWQGRPLTDVELQPDHGRIGEVDAGVWSKYLSNGGAWAPIASVAVEPGSFPLINAAVISGHVPLSPGVYRLRSTIPALSADVTFRVIVDLG
ncbi:MAG: hypothetical protein KKC03_13285 [Bacteroidetes bacterium]|nr:hypothetical protein [Bacteroidota bacterium]